eukprot:TRINITY_DN897_c0_g2_i5.p2 TRINITY_DN897_c0_g2~~TRINITY_DN897_c0_g2_i5.p2  ORF type:complete len:126 (-),score=46.06 TRINITY_DN897_c0_g2_i5:15-392(-)
MVFQFISIKLRFHDICFCNFSRFFFFFSSRRRHTRCREVSWARRCVQETGINAEYMGRVFFSFQPVSYTHLTLPTILLVQISVVAVSLKKKKKQGHIMNTDITDPLKSELARAATTIHVNIITRQ